MKLLLKTSYATMWIQDDNVSTFNT